MKRNLVLVKSVGSIFYITEHVHVLKNSLAVKNGAALFKMVSVKKREQPRNGCDVMIKVDGKTFNNSHSGQFVLPHSSFTRNQHEIHLNCCY